MSEEAPSGPFPDGSGLRIAVAAARFNESLVGPMLQRAESLLRESRAAVETIRVPGSWELPYIAARLAEQGEFDSVLVLGVVVAGETDHHEHIAQATGFGIQEVAIRTGIPVINGILVTENRKQAEDRTLGKIDKGSHFARAAIEMARIRRSLKAND